MASVGGIASKKVMRRFPLNWSLAKEMFDIVMKDFDKTRPFISSDIFDVEIYYRLYRDTVPEDRQAEFSKYSNRWKRGLTKYRRQRMTGSVLTKEIERGVLGTKNYTRKQLRRTPFGGLMKTGRPYFYFIGHFKPFPETSHLTRMQREEAMAKGNQKKKEMLYAIYGFENAIQCRNWMGIVSEKTGKPTRCPNRFEYARNKKFCDDCKQLRRNAQSRIYRKKQAAKLRRIERNKLKHKKTYVYKTIKGWSYANQELAKEDPEEFFRILMDKLNKGELK